MKHLAHLLMLLYHVINHHHHQKAIVGNFFFFYPLNYPQVSGKQDRSSVPFYFNQKVKIYVKTVRYILLTF